MAIYTSREIVKSQLDITSTTYDTDIDTYIESASRWIDKYCLWDGVTDPFYVQSDTTRYYDRGPIDGRTLWLDVPILTITSITNGDGQSVSSSNYRLMPRNEQRYNSIKLNEAYSWLFSTLDSEITIVGKFGHSTSVPQPVQEACTWLAGWIHKRYRAGLASNSAIIELGQLQHQGDIPGTVKQMLEPYRYTRRML